MTGLELLGFLACGRLKERDSFVRLDAWRNMIITVQDGNFIDYWKTPMTWSEHNLNAEWEVYEEEEQKPKLDEKEKRICRKLLEMGYDDLLRQWDGILCAYSKDHYNAIIFDGFDFIKLEDSEPTSIEWLLGRE